MADLPKRLVLLALNEVNFDIVRKYIALDDRRFPALQRLLQLQQISTASESSYDELEPWIQWPSVHTMLRLSEHRIFRLGDVVVSTSAQIFEILERAGYKIGAISAMNADNRLKEPAFFIPDPWTQTRSDGSWWSRSIGYAISQLVNDNSRKKITVRSAIYFLLALLRFSRFRNWRRYFRYILGSIDKPWMRALVLDLLLHDIHRCLFNRTRADFSTLFLNSGAHIQHHYFFNCHALTGDIDFKNPDWYVKSGLDPIADVLDLYNDIVGDFLECTDIDVIFATGLTQKPYDRVKFYYRLKSHADFLRDIGVDFAAVYPRMTRDFLLVCRDEDCAKFAQERLSEITIQGDGLQLFGEIDNRGTSLFVTLTYPHEITAATRYLVDGRVERLDRVVSFVAIKNGMHQAEGFAFFTNGVSGFAPDDMSHVSGIGKSILDYFGVSVENN